MGLISRFFELSPYIEVIARRVYWNSPWLIELMQKKAVKRARNLRAGAQTLSAIERFLTLHGVSRGTLLIVHSSGAVLTDTGSSPAQILDWLIGIVGPTGTLAMPAFPKYRDEPQGIDRIRADVSNLELVYDVKKTIPWTGLLPLKMMGRPGALRSRHPLNSMVALGPLAGAMMDDNLKDERSLPCGPQSSWKFCADHGAIIVSLGVDMAHNLTMIHVAEDSYEHEWPVKNWYRPRRFLVKDAGTSKHVVVRERHPQWAMHYAERTLSKDLRRKGLLARTWIDGIVVEVIKAPELLRFLSHRRSTGYPYFMIPRAQRKLR